MLKQHEEMKETCKAKETHQNQNNTVIYLTNKLEIKQRSRHDWRVTGIEEHLKTITVNTEEDYQEAQTIRDKIRCSVLDDTKQTKIIIVPEIAYSTIGDKNYSEIQWRKISLKWKNGICYLNGTPYTQRLFDV